MTKYLFTYSGGGGMPETDEQQAAEMAKWGEWYGALGAAIVDGGAPTGAVQTVSADGSVTDGGNVTGWGVFEADSLAGAVELAKGCPVLSNGGSVEVGEAIDVAM
ncbi:MAG: hypothetical protein OEW42_20310 [Acidimicrobiia bacterium]|nr:hypothetical protein [Acidimicrobiia bacterium]